MHNAQCTCNYSFIGGVTGAGITGETYQMMHLHLHLHTDTLTYTYSTLDAPPLSAKFSDGGAKYQIIHLQFLLCRVDTQVSQEVPELLGGHKPRLCLVKLPERLDKL